MQHPNCGWLLHKEEKNCIEKSVRLVLLVHYRKQVLNFGLLLALTSSHVLHTDDFGLWLIRRQANDWRQCFHWNASINNYRAWHVNIYQRAQVCQTYFPCIWNWYMHVQCIYALAVYDWLLFGFCRLKRGWSQITNRFDTCLYLSHLFSLSLRLVFPFIHRQNHRQRCNYTARMMLFLFHIKTTNTHTQTLL